MEPQIRNTALCGETAPLHLCSEASRLLEEALGMPPGELKEEVEESERAVVRLRDCVIDRLRSESGDTTRWRKPLDDINVALTLIAGVEYPASGIHREYMEQAKELLKQVQETLK